jgi:cytochrome P450
MTETARESTDVIDRDLGGCPVVNVEVFAPMEAGSYWRKADELRETSPRFFNTLAQGFWMFTRHEQVREIYQNPDLFSSESFTPWEPEPVYRFVPTQIDPPQHQKYRQVLSRWFSPGAVNQLEPRARELCRRLIADIAPQGRCDFVSEFAIRYPTEVFLTMLGLPAQEADLFVPWVEDFFDGFGGDPDPAKQQAMVDALTDIREYWVAALAERRGESEPREGDLASHLLHSTIDDRALTDAELLDMLTVLVLAGLDTTRGQLGYLFRHLATHPDDRQRLVAEPGLVRPPSRSRCGSTRSFSATGARSPVIPSFTAARSARETWSTGSCPPPTATRECTSGQATSSSTARATRISVSRAARTAASAPTLPARRCRSRLKSG